MAFIIGSSGKCRDDFIAIASLNSSYQKKLNALFDVICKPLTADKALIKSWLCVMELSTLRIHLNLKSPLLFVLAYVSSIPAMPQLAQMCCLEGEFQIQFCIVIPIYYKLIRASVKGQSLWECLTAHGTHRYKSRELGELIPNYNLVRKIS